MAIREPQNSPSDALNGYRALAILVVMLVHTRFGEGYPVWMTPLDPFIKGGVTAFMVLSGYLITHSLLGEEQRAGRMDQRAFLGKQGVRYFVPALAYLALALGIWSWQMPGFNYVAALRLLWLSPWTGDGFNGGTALTWHLYSLAAQMQFCVWWPLVLRWIPRGKRLAPVTVLMLLAATWRIMGREYAAARDATPMRTDYVYGSLLVGAWWALLARKGRMDWILRLTGIRLLPVFLAAVLVVWATRSPSAFLELISPKLRELAAPWREIPSVALGVRVLLSLVALMAFGCLTFLLHQGRPVLVARLFAWRGITWLGRISFSVYLWQNVFCFGVTNTSLDRFPFNLLASVGCGYLAYRWVELPSLQLRNWVKHRLQQQTSAPTSV